MSTTPPKRKNRLFNEQIPIYSPRTTYSKIKQNDQKMISDMTLNFDKITISLLKKSFEQKNNKLKLQQFILLAKQHLNFWQPQLKNREIILIRYLTQLFMQIDVNNNKFMQWKQLTNYIIQKAIVLKNLKSKSQQIKKYVKSDVQIKLKIDNIIQKAQYIKDIQKMAFFYQGGNKIYFVDLKTGDLFDKTLDIDPKKLIISVSSIKKNKNNKKLEIKKKDFQIPTDIRVLDILYLNDKKYKCLLVATSDGFVRGWKYTQTGFVLATQPDNQEQFFQHYFNSEIYSMSWDHVNQVLFCGQKNGNIYMWNLKTDLQKSLCQYQDYHNNQNQLFSNDQNHQKQNQNKRQNPISQQKINKMITKMITMPKLQFMASGRMDGKLILWDTINNKKKWTYREHTRGILSLAFNQSMILLFSAGFDHKICVWNPYISTLIHKVQTHLSPILGLKVIDSSNQLISLDNEGIVKITDTKRFNQIYSFLIERPQSTPFGPSLTTHANYNLSSFIAIDRPLKLVFFGRSLSIYQYDKNYNPQTADQNVVIGCKYIKELLCFVTAAGNKVKLWSALNGDISKIFIDICQYQITVMALDTIQKKLILGDIKGNITIHNVINGAKMKHLTKHQLQVMFIQTMKSQQKTEMIISCSIDNQIRIFKQNQDNYQVIRSIYFRKDIQISYLKYEQNINLMMIGTNVGKVGFYDAETGKNIGNCHSSINDQITSICQTKQSMIITSSSTGKITLFGIPPLYSKFQKILSFSHFDCQKNDSISTIGITASCYNTDLNLFYVLDDKNYLTSYNLQGMNNVKNNIGKQKRHGALGGGQKEKQKEKNVMEKKNFGMRRSNILQKNQNSINNFSQIQVPFNVSLPKSIPRLKFSIIFQVHTNQQMGKFIQFIKQQEILIISSFDKKVYFFNSSTGEHIDSLQQNYSKSQPQPIAFYDAKNETLYQIDKITKIDTDIKLDIGKLQYQCLQLQQILLKYDNLKSKNSCLDWKLKVDINEEQNKLKLKLKEVQKILEVQQNKQLERRNKHKIQTIFQWCNKDKIKTKSKSKNKAYLKKNNEINHHKNKEGQQNQNKITNNNCLTKQLINSQNKSVFFQQNDTHKSKNQNNNFNSNSISTLNLNAQFNKKQNSIINENNSNLNNKKQSTNLLKASLKRKIKQNLYKFKQNIKQIQTQIQNKQTNFNDNSSSIYNNFDHKDESNYNTQDKFSKTTINYFNNNKDINYSRNNRNNTNYLEVKSKFTLGNDDSSQNKKNIQPMSYVQLNSFFNKKKQQKKNRVSINKKPYGNFYIKNLEEQNLDQVKQLKKIQSQNQILNNNSNSIFKDQRQIKRLNSVFQTKNFKNKNKQINYKKQKKQGKQNNNTQLKKQTFNSIHNSIIRSTYNNKEQNKKNLNQQQKDYLPIYQVLGLKKKKKNFNQHKIFIENLYKRQTESMLNKRLEEQVYLGQQQAIAAKKLCQVLLKIDETDKRPKSLLKNMKIKNVCRSMHIQREQSQQRFPKIP